MDAILDHEHPGLVVLNGDLVTGENLFLENSTEYIDMLAGPMERRNIPWASSYGNHDYQKNITGATILERERRHPHARSSQMVFAPDAGTSNYYIPVYSERCLSHWLCTPELILWFFDSRGGSKYQTPPELSRHDNWVHQSVVDWYEQTTAHMTRRYRKTIPSMGFTHHPPGASLRLQQVAGVHPNRQPGINHDSPLAPQAEGYCADGANNGTCDYGGQDIPFIKALARTPGMMALFSGHDHGNTWCHKWDSDILDSMSGDKGNGTIKGRRGRGHEQPRRESDLHLCFGQHTGYGGYRNWIRGARQIHVARENLKELAFDTWNRLEDGGTVGSISLNGTYGQDWYPEVPSDETFL